MSNRQQILSKGNYRVRIANTPGDLAASLALRTLCFETCKTDVEAVDQNCSHLLVEDTRTNDLVCSFRIMQLSDGGQISQSYAARYYGLSTLEEFPGPMIELGRFCIHPDRKDPDILRMAWGALTRLVDEYDVQMLFGCSSFAGTLIEPYQDVFKLLKDRHLAPSRWLPKGKADNIYPYARILQGEPDVKSAFAQMPPLLRSYLVMGGWVSDHAVVDDEMNTLHVFTGLEVSSIPVARQRLLRALAE